jgi:hypothetical protein
MKDETEREDPNGELTRLIEISSKTPGVQELMALYSYYRKIEDVAGPVRRALQARSYSTVSDGSYPSLAR